MNKWFHLCHRVMLQFVSVNAQLFFVGVPHYVFFLLPCCFRDPEIAKVM